MNKDKDVTQEELAEVFKAERPRLLRYACYRLCNEVDAEDVLQETFLKLHSRLQDSEGQEIYNLQSYLFRTLTNICTKWQTNNSRIKTVPLDIKADMADSPTETRNDDYRRIARLLKEIPEEQAEVIRLRIYGDNSFMQIAEILSLPLSTVKSRFLYGLEKIRRGMKQTNVKSQKGMIL